MITKRTFCLLLLAASCGRTGFDALGITHGQGEDTGGSGDGGGDSDASDGDGAGVNPAACGSVNGFDSAQELAAPPLADTSLGAVVRNGTSYVIAGYRDVAPSHTASVVFGYNEQSNVWVTLDSQDTGDTSEVRAVSIALAGTALFYIGTQSADTNPPFAFVRQSPDAGASWATPFVSDVGTSAVDIVAPSAQTIIALQNYSGSVKTGWAAASSVNGGASWSEVDGPFASDRANALADLSIGTVGLGQRLGDAGSAAWIVHLTRDRITTPWTQLGPWFVGSGGRTTATLGFVLPGSDALYVGGTVDGENGVIARIARIEADGSATTVDELSIAGSQVAVASRMLLHSGGCALIFENSGDVLATPNVAHIRGTVDGGTWHTLTPPAGLRAINSAVELANGDLLASATNANGASVLVRLPLIR